MLLQIKSDNPDFSFCLCKNPTSPPKVMSIRRGVGIGWYHEQDYCISFRDEPDEVSYPDYKDQEFEYLSQGHFSSPVAAFNLLSDFCRLDISRDLKCNHSIIISAIRCKPKALSLFKSYHDFTITEKELGRNIYKLTISKECTLQDIVNFAILMTYYLALDNNELYSTDDLKVKILDLMTDLDSPYFVRYMIKTNLCRNSKKKFELLEEKLNSSASTTYEFCAFNNFDARQRWILSQIGDEDVIDFGCGEGRYATRLANDKRLYIGVDQNEDRYEKTKAKLERKDCNYKLFSGLDCLRENIDNGNYTVILTEVIEHNEPEELNAIVDYFNSCEFVNKILITTPNLTFNSNYFNCGLRDEDHNFEFSQPEFEEFLTKFTNFNTECVGIGDKVNGECTTHGGLLCRK